MNLFVAGILKMVLLEAVLAAILASFVFERTDRHRRAFDWLFGLLAIAAVVGFFNFGSFRRSGRLIHGHEHYHFFLGSKYLHELRYDGIYWATVEAAAEGGLRGHPIRRIRDPMTFGLVRPQSDRDRISEIRGRFDAPRWASFVEDVRFYLDTLKIDSRSTLTDHGNTGSPSWAMVASVFTATLPLGTVTANLIAQVDMLLMGLLFIFVWRSFGRRTALVSMAVGLLIPRVYDWLGGSILRMDWVFAFGMSVCLFQSRRFRTAGVFLGYAVSTKLFVGLLVLPIGLKILSNTIEKRQIEANHLKYIFTSSITLCLLIAASSFYFNGFAIWEDYASRLLVTFSERYYSDQYSFRDIFLQLDLGFFKYIVDPTPIPVAASISNVDIANYRTPFSVTQIILAALLLIPIIRNSERFSFALGPLFVFLGLVTNMYYWQMLLFSIIPLASAYRRSRRYTLYLGAIIVFLMTSYLFEHYGNLRRLQGYFGSYRILVAYVLVVLVEIASIPRIRQISARLRQFARERWRRPAPSSLDHESCSEPARPPP